MNIRIVGLVLLLVVALVGWGLIANPNGPTADLFRQTDPPYTLDGTSSGVIVESPQRLGCISEPVDISGASEVQIYYGLGSTSRRVEIMAYISDGSRGRWRLLGGLEPTSQRDYFRVYKGKSPAPHGTRLEILLAFDPGAAAVVYLGTAIKRDGVRIVHHTDLQHRRPAHA